MKLERLETSSIPRDRKSLDGNVVEAEVLQYTITVSKVHDFEIDAIA
jgi:hypothetical protein